MGASRSLFWSVACADLYRYGDGVSVKAFFRHYVLTPGFKYTFLMRMTASLANKRFMGRCAYYLCRFLLYRSGLKYGISIPYNTCIGAGLYIGHHGGIVVNSGALIGRDCNINHGVTIGVKYGGKNSGVPRIGDRNYLGPGCTVIGGVKLGNDVAIGANAVVLESVPHSAVVVGVPGRVVGLRGSSNYVANTGYI